MISEQIKMISFNFIIFFVAQMVFELFVASASGDYPTQFELYKCVLSSLAATFTFFGIIRLRPEL